MHNKLIHKVRNNYMVQLSCFTQVHDNVHVYVVHFQTDFKPTAVNAHSQDWGKLN